MRLQPRDFRRPCLGTISYENGQAVGMRASLAAHLHGFACDAQGAHPPDVSRATRDR